MVIGDFKELGRYAPLHPRFSAAFAYLRELLAAGAADGKHVADAANGTDAPEAIYVNLCTCALHGGETARAESHMRYIDVQVVLTGEEEMYVPATEPRVEEESAEQDYRLFEPTRTADCTRLTVRAGQFAIFFPGELHAPCHTHAACIETRKAIVKVLK